MEENELNAPAGEQQDTSGETIATETASHSTSEEAAAADQAEESTADDKAEADDAGADDQPEGDKPADKAKPPLDWKEKRRIEETNKRRAAEAELNAIKAEMAALKASVGKSADAEAAPAEKPAISMDEAKRLARAELEQEQRAKSFQEATGRVLQAGIQNIPDFEQARQEMVTNFGDQLNARPDFFEAITDPDIPNGHEIFYHLAKDPEQTERILSLPPVKMAIEIAKLSEKVAKPAAKPISKAPAPVKPVGGTPQATDRLDDPNIPMDQFAKSYLKQMAGKGR